MEKNKIIEELQYCAAQCTHCYDACHLENDSHMDICMENDQDCAEICRLTAQLIDRDSPNVDIFLKLSSEMCERCAIECEKHSGFEYCIKCAESCRKCVEVCQEHKLVHS